MATLPDPTESLTGADLEAFRHMAGVRAHAEGRAALGEVYVRMFNAPAVARRVGALGELEGLDPSNVAAVAGDGLPDGLRDDQAAALAAVDAVVAHRSIPAGVQERIVAAHGLAGAVEIVALCGLYAVMGYTVSPFDIPLEDGLPQPPWADGPGRKSSRSGENTSTATASSSTWAPCSTSPAMHQLSPGERSRVSSPIVSLRRPLTR